MCSFNLSLLLASDSSLWFRRINFSQRLPPNFSACKLFVLTSYLCSRDSQIMNAALNLYRARVDTVILFVTPSAIPSQAFIFSLNRCPMDPYLYDAPNRKRFPSLHYRLKPYATKLSRECYSAPPVGQPILAAVGFQPASRAGLSPDHAA